jgi:hypothetical protein
VDLLAGPGRLPGRSAARAGGDPAADGVLPADVPTWYVTFQGIIGLAQVAIGLAMLAGYQRCGVWGSF